MTFLLGSFSSLLFVSAPLVRKHCIRRPLVPSAGVAHVAVELSLQLLWRHFSSNSLSGKMLRLKTKVPKSWSACMHVKPLLSLKQLRCLPRIGHGECQHFGEIEAVDHRGLETRSY